MTRINNSSILHIVFALVVFLATLGGCISENQLPPAPEEGAEFVTELTQRVGVDMVPSIVVGDYQYVNDGDAAGWIMVMGVWVYGDVPDAFMVQSDSYVIKRGHIFQNDGGKLYIWKLAEGGD